MSKGLLFWILMVLWAVLSVLSNRTPGDVRLSWGGTFLEFVLFFLLGWAIFGFVVQ